MFEEIVSNAVQMLILIFLGTSAFLIIWGALWVRLYKKTKVNTDN